MNEKFRIGVYDEIEEVYINFFINQEIIEENKIGDTYISINFKIDVVLFTI